MWHGGADRIEKRLHLSQWVQQMLFIANTMLDIGVGRAECRKDLPGIGERHGGRGKTWAAPEVVAVGWANHVGWDSAGGRGMLRFRIWLGCRACICGIGVLDFSLLSCFSSSVCFGVSSAYITLMGGSGEAEGQWWPWRTQASFRGFLCGPGCPGHPFHHPYLLLSKEAPFFSWKGSSLGAKR